MVQRLSRISRATVWLLAVSGAAALPSQMRAQDAQAPQLSQPIPSQSEPARDADRRIHLHVVVTDALSQPITGLAPKDLSVFVNGHLQKIDSFHEVNGATNSGVFGLLVLDLINDYSGDLSRIRSRLIAALKQGHGPLPFPLQIVVVSEDGTDRGQLTTDRNALIADMLRLTHHVRIHDCDYTPKEIPRGPGATGRSVEEHRSCVNTHLMQSLVTLKHLAESAQKLDKPTVVIWTGPGWVLPRNLKTIGIGPDGPIRPLDMVVPLEREMQEGQVTLEAIAPGKFRRAHLGREARLKGEQVSPSIGDGEAALELPAIAKQSGGLALEKEKSFPNALNRFLNDGDRYYSLAFDSAPASAKDEYRSIEVKVDRPGATVRTLTGYYTQP
jgi:VWFA-related protein